MIQNNTKYQAIQLPRKPNKDISELLSLICEGQELIYIHPDCCFIITGKENRRIKTKMNKNNESKTIYIVMTLPSNVQAITDMLNEKSAKGFNVHSITDHLVIFQKS